MQKFIVHRRITVIATVTAEGGAQTHISIPVEVDFEALFDECGAHLGCQAYIGNNISANHRDEDGDLEEARTHVCIDQNIYQ